jgi:hypothetical protein
VSESTEPSTGEDELLEGELVVTTRHPLLTALLSATPLLLLLSLWRAFLRLGLAYRRPAQLRLGPQTLQISFSMSLAGRVLRREEQCVKASELSRVARQVHYQNAGLYTGLVALALGSYFGFGLLLDGVRVPSGSLPLLGLGLGIVLLGLGLDFLLSTAWASARRRTRIALQTHSGQSLLLETPDGARAKRWVELLLERWQGDGAEASNPQAQGGVPG